MRVVIALMFVMIMAPRAVRAVPEEGKKQGRPQIFRDLGLTETQRMALKSFREERGKIREGVRQMKAERLALGQLLKDPSVDEVTMARQAEKVLALMGDTLRRRVQNVARLKQILSPEQFSKVVAAMETHVKERRGGKDIVGR